jgi:5,10-methylenetetrahydromethanopterin reductase
MERRVIEFWQTNNPANITPAKTARDAEADGWDGVVFMDSQSLTGDPYVIMGAWASATERLKLATFVTNPLTRHPAVTAASAATLHHLTGGRAVLGIGRGDSALAYLGYAPVRVAAFERCLRDIQALLSGGEVAFASDPKADAPSLDSMSLGDRPHGSRLEWLPKGMSKVPLDVAVTGQKVTELAAPIAERVTFSVGAIGERLRWSLDVARAARAKQGLTDQGVSYGAHIILICHPDPEIANDAARSFVAPLARFQVIQNKLAGPIAPGDEANYAAVRDNYDMTKHAERSGEHGKLVGTAITQDFMERFAIVGTPDRCTERLLELIDCGIERFVLVGPGLHPEAAAPGRTLFGSEVIPAVRAALSSKVTA